MLAMKCSWLVVLLLASCALPERSADLAELPTEMVYKTVGEVELRLLAHYPAGHTASDTRPAVVFFFGGGWNGGRIDQFALQARYLASRGMVALLADYRVKSRHGTTPFACVADGKSAIRWVRAHAKRIGVDANRIAAAGGSAGGHVAAATGVIDGLEEPLEDHSVSSRADALLLFNPVFDNGPDGYGYSRVKERFREISPLHNLRAGAPPTIVLLGTEDRLIPVATAQEYQRRMQQVGSRCDLHLYEGQGHGFFNRDRNVRHYCLTVRAMDEFLITLGWLQGQPTILVP